jgi:hypothetical protein
VVEPRGVGLPRCGIRISVEAALPGEAAVLGWRISGSFLEATGACSVSAGIVGCRICLLGLEHVQRGMSLNEVHLWQMRRRRAWEPGAGSLSRRIYKWNASGFTVGHVVVHRQAATGRP